MLIGYKRGQASVVLRVKILDSTVSTGAGKTGFTSGTSGLIVSTIADNEASATAYSGSNLETITTLGTFATPTSGKARFKEVDATNHPGVYEVQIADARYAVSSAKSLLVSLSGATGGANCDVVIPLRDLDPYDSVRAGLTALPNAAAEASGGLYTRGTGAGQITQATNGQIDVDAKKINAVSTSSVTTVSANVGTTQPLNFTGTGASALAKSDMVDVAGAAVSTSSAQIGVNAVNLGGTAQTGRDVGASVLLSSGTGTGQLDFTSGVVKASLAQILGTALTETSGQLAGGFKKFFNIGTPAATMDHGILVDTATATGSIGTGGIASASFAAGAIDAAAIAASAIGSSELAAGAITSAKFATDAIDSTALAASAASEIAAAVFATAFSAAYGGLTFTQLTEVIVSACAGVASGLATTTATYRNLNNSGDVIVATVDANGNRSAVTLTP